VTRNPHEPIGLGSELHTRYDRGRVSVVFTSAIVGRFLLHPTQTRPLSSLVGDDAIVNNPTVSKFS
jgi:hypothetical protein